LLPWERPKKPSWRTALKEGAGELKIEVVIPQLNEEFKLFHVPANYSQQ